MFNDNPERPTIITVICILGWLGALVSTLGFLLQLTPYIATWYQILTLLLALTSCFALYGFWSMQRWGVWLHGFLVVVNQVVLFILGFGIYSLIFLIIPGAVLGIGVFYYQKMTRGFSLTAAYGFGKKEAKITGIILLIGFVLSVAMGYLIYSLDAVSENSIDQNQSTETSSTEELSFVDIPAEDKEFAQHLQDIMPIPDDFSGEYEIVSSYYTYTKDDALTYQTLWENQAIIRLKDFYKEHGQPDDISSMPENIRTDARNVQSFLIVISKPDNPEVEVAKMKDESLVSQLSQEQQSLITLNYVESQGLEAVGDGHASIHTSRSSQAYIDSYTFHTGGYLVAMTPFISANSQAFSEYILPKARIIDQRIRQYTDQ